MDKRYQVFVSSTYEDLQEERKEVMQALLELDCIPAGMELFPASNDDQWTLIKKVIDDCDYYILIIGGRYGSTNEEGKSYTQMEFEYALSTNKPIISFLPKHPENIVSGKSEQDPDKKEKLETFKELAKQKLIKYWDNPENLGSVVSRSMVRLIKDYPAEGWVKSGSAIDENSVKEIARLQKENNELKEKLNTIATEAPRGTEIFSQGEDEVCIYVKFEAYSKDNNYSTYRCNSDINLTWNEIFSTIAPSMINECTDSKFKSCLNSLLKNNSKKIVDHDDFIMLERFHNFEIDSESFDLIKVQFRALGLICLSDKKRTASDRNTYWKLTPYGDYMMTQLLALKKDDVK